MRHVFFLFFAAFLLFSALPAQAEEFYVELGREKTEADVQQTYAALQAKNKALQEYDVFPNAILMPDGSFTYRVQAGPMLDKAEANKLCSKLSKRKVSCFVIEGFDPKRAPTFVKTVAATGGDNSNALPWRIAPNKEPEEASKSEDSGSSFFGSIFSSSDEPAKQEEEPVVITEEIKAPAAPREAKVDVAEAIPVALSTDTQPTESVTIGEAAPIAESDDITPLTTATTNQPGWLNVQPFLDEGRAQKFWTILRGSAPKETRNLTMSVVRPIVSHDLPKVVLSLGTFASETDAMDFCRQNVSPASRYLECRFSLTPPESQAGEVVDNVDMPEHSLYWVEVLNEKSQNIALEKWEDIRTQHDDLLSDLRSQITTSFSQPGNYVVRIGPINSHTQAVSLCSTLKARKLSCSLVSL